MSVQSIIEILVPVAKVTGIVSSSFFAGYNVQLNESTMPTLITLKADEAVQLAEWRKQYVNGYSASLPITVTNALSYGILAYAARNPLSQMLFVTAAITTSSGAFWAATILKSCNGALCIRSNRLAGPSNAGFPVTYALNSSSSIEMEKKTSTTQLLKMWMEGNQIRTFVFLAGAIVGGVALSLESMSS